METHTWRYLVIPVSVGGNRLPDDGEQPVAAAEHTGISTGYYRG